MIPECLPWNICPIQAITAYAAFHFSNAKDLTTSIITTGTKFHRLQDMPPKRL